MARGARFRVGLVAGRLDPVLAKMVKRLRKKQVEVDVWDPDAEGYALDGLRVEHDLYVIASSTPAALTLAGILDRAGARLLNPFPALVTLRDPIVTADVLRRAGVRIPEGPLGTAMSTGRPQPDDDQHTLEVGRIGNELVGLRRDATTGETTLFDLTPEMDAMTRAVGVALRIALYSLELVVSEGRPYVVGVRPFGHFEGFPKAHRRLCHHVRQALKSGPPARLPIIDASWYSRPEGMPEEHVAGGVVVRRGESGPLVAILRQIRDGRIKYCLPKGHVEDGETADEAARREIQEESGISELEKICDLETLGACNKQKTAWKVNHFALFHTHESQSTPPERDKELCWYPLDAVPTMFWPHQNELLRTHADTIREAVR